MTSAINSMFFQATKEPYHKDKSIWGKKKKKKKASPHTVYNVR